jgi:predicted NBD/HSP70 family sugar kinase
MNAARLRAQNTVRLLNLIWREREISRAELARRTGLAPSTVSVIVGSLLKDGLVRTSHVAKSRGGRPPIVLRFDDQRFHIVGVEMGASHLSAVITDLRGATIAARSAHHPVEDDPEGTAELLAEMIRSLLDDADLEVEGLAGIGVGAPSPIDPNEPDQMSPRILPKWRDMRLGALLQRRFARPVWIDNDANLGALAEHWWGAGAGVDHLAYIKVATGVGAGLIIGGDIYGGSYGIAGEVGHTAIDPNGPRCRCGLSGCLEAMIGARSLVARMRELSGDGRGRGETDPARSTLRIVEAARAGDEVSARVIEEAGTYLGIAIANLLNLLNPARIVLGGSLTAAGDLLLQPLHRTIADRTLRISATLAEVRMSRLGTQAVALGAATRVLQAVLADPSLLSHPTSERSHETREPSSVLHWGA